jgi:hypothetical protein
MKFAEICREARKTAHKVYGFETNVPELTDKGTTRIKTKVHFAKKSRKENLSPAAELKQKRNAEREDRAIRLERLVETAGDMAERQGLDRLALLEAENVCIASMINPPEHITLADNKLAIRFTGLR